MMRSVSEVPMSSSGAERLTRISTLMADLYPLCRSITGHGTRATLGRVASEIGIQIHEVPTGTQVLDWTVPDEWLFERAVLIDPLGDLVVDSNDHSLHVVGYSEGVRRRLTLEELLPHLHSLPEQPNSIPYRTSYYNRTWGLCLPHAQRANLRPGTYEVEIDASLEPGALTYGELVVPGRSDREFLVSTHICHPSLANDNLTGIAAAVALADWVGSADRRLTYRFLFVPATIGAISWLARNQAETAKIVAGLAAP
jgi:aminopeptidase-like protein